MNEVDRLRRIETAAHFLLVHRYQECISNDPGPQGWRVTDLHPGVWNRMDATERDLYTALGGSAKPSAE